MSAKRSNRATTLYGWIGSGLITATIATVVALTGLATGEDDAQNEQISASEPTFESRGITSVAAACLGDPLDAVIRIRGTHNGETPYAGPRRVATRLDTRSAEHEFQVINLGKLTGVPSLGQVKIKYMVAEAGKVKSKIYRIDGGTPDLRVNRRYTVSDRFVFNGSTFNDVCAQAGGLNLARTLIQITRVDPELNIRVTKLSKAYCATLTVKQLTLEATNTIELPQWRGYKNADAFDRGLWNNFLDRIQARESARADLNDQCTQMIMDHLIHMKIDVCADSDMSADRGKYG